MKYRNPPCQKCGWKFPGFHICLDLPEEVMQRVEDGRTRGPKRTKSESDAETTTKTSVTTFRDPRKINRNREIIAHYKRGLTVREITDEMALPDSTVMNVLHRAADEGDVVIRRVARTAGRT